MSTIVRAQGARPCSYVTGGTERLPRGTAPTLRATDRATAGYYQIRQGLRVGLKFQYFNY